uniref:Uncharacterized protein n=1 Tax=Panagrolaimus sp. ES5 TaxID=591445 RepID=A0AC34F7Z7_9BILA
MFSLKQFLLLIFAIFALASTGFAGYYRPPPMPEYQPPPVPEYQPPPVQEYQPPVQEYQPPQQPSYYQPPLGK